LIVATEVAPRRARWTVLPARFSFAHRLPPWFRSIVSQCLFFQRSVVPSPACGGGLG
jgi:hypothetical protein